MLSPLLAFKMLYGKQSYCYSLLYLFYVVLESEYMSRTDSIIILDYSFSPFLHKNSIYFPIGMWFTMCLWEEQQNKVTRFYSIKFERRERREKREREHARERMCALWKSAEFPLEYLSNQCRKLSKIRKRTPKRMRSYGPHN